jgi:amino-acid N-acetyltransferase
VSLEIEALLSQGLPNTPMAGSTIRVVGGNFITAKPMGVLDGVDLHYTGVVRKVDTEGIKAQLGLGNIVLLSCVGVSPTGENFNLNHEDVAEQVAVTIGAEKLIFVTDRPGLTAEDGTLLEELTAEEAESLLKSETWLSSDLKRCLPSCIRASRKGVGRIHLVGYQEDGALLEELFTRDGIGTLITKRSLEVLRDARADDIAGLIALIEPMEEQGILVRRSRELLEREIGQFSVLEHDAMIVGCAALYPYGAGQGELACLAVQEDFRHYGHGEQLLKAIEARAKGLGVRQLFVLTTRTAHWFIERGFVPAGIDQLPAEKRLVYNYQRNSKAFIKNL